MIQNHKRIIPLGALVFAIGLGVVAWQYWGDWPIASQLEQVVKHAGAM